MARKLTYEEVRRFIEVESESGCILLSEIYKNNKTKLEIKCKCGEMFEVSYHNFKKKDRYKRQCNTCSGVKRYTYLEVKQYIEVISKSDCILLSTSYNGVYDKLSLQCKCGNKFVVHFSDFKNAKKIQCNKCSGWNRHTYEDIKNFIENESNSGCVLLSEEYISVNNKLEIKCKCGDIFRTDFNHFKGQNKRQCDVCGGRVVMNNEDFRKRIQKLTNNEYVVLGEYVGISSHVRIKHNICGYEWDVIPDNFIHKGSRCPECANRLRKSTEQFKQDVYNLVGDEYSVIGEYVNNRTSVKMRHSDCGHEWDVRPHNFLNRKTCPQCSESKGEKQIRLYLEKQKVNFEQEYSFDNLIGVGGGLLRFDFSILDRNGKRRFLIEYDGEFHFKKFYEEQNFDELQIHDKRKNQYCKDNSIPLIRIPYWQFDKIEQILDKWLNKYGLIHNDGIKEID